MFSNNTSYEKESTFFLDKSDLEQKDGSMVKALTVLEEDPGLIPSTPLVAHSHQEL